MANRYEYYITGDDGQFLIHTVNWRAQTFTPATAHKITSVKLLLYRVGSPGQVTVGIRATDGSGHPTGEDLCSGTTNGNTLPTESPFEWREITLGDGYNLNADTKYAIVVRMPGGDGANYVQWRRDGSSPTYTKGNAESSNNSGETWATLTSWDFMFEEWGEAIEEAIVKISAETVGLIESFLNRMRAARLITETISLADSAIRRAMASRIADEAINITETMVWVFLATFTETVGIAESLIRTAGITKVFSEAIAIADGLVKRFWATRLITEAISIAETSIKRLWSIRLSAETITIVETAIRRSRAVRLMVETVGIADTLVRRLRSVRVINETLSIVEGFVKHIVGLVNIFSHESGVGQERASRAGWLMKPSVYTKDAFEQKTYTGE